MRYILYWYSNFCDKKYRKELGYTQEEMANRLGVTTPAVNKWEKGKYLPD